MPTTATKPQVPYGQRSAELAIEGFLNRPVKMTDEHRSAMRAHRLDPDSDATELNIELPDSREQRALSAVIGSSGGYVAPEVGFIPAWFRSQFALPMLREATTSSITDGSVFRQAFSSYSTEGSLIGENTAATGTDVAWSQLVHFPYKHTSGLVKVPRELPEDSGPTFAAQLAGLLGIPVALNRNHLYTTGSGASRPMGIVPAVVQAGATATAANSGTIGLVSALQLLDTIGAGFFGDGCKWMLHKDTLLSLLKLKDSTGRNLVELRDGKMRDFPVVLNAHMPTIASGNCSIIFGRLDFYQVVEFKTLRLTRTIEAHAENDQEGYQAFFRTSGNLIPLGEPAVVGLVHP